ncbi:MAG: GspE/PulE family protein [Rhizobiaceae bacterium]
MDAITESRHDFAAFIAFLEEGGVLSHEAALRARNAYASTNHPADTVLIELGLTREGDLVRNLSGFLGLPVLERLPDNVDSALIEQVGLGFLETNQVIPIGENGEEVVIAVADPFHDEPVNAISYLLDRPAALAIFPRSAIVERIRHLMDRNEAGEQSEFDTLEVDRDSDDIDRLRDFAREAPVIKFVSRIIQQAVDRGATDLHIEPMADKVRIRFRCDGMLVPADTAPRAMHAGIATRIKILSRLNIAERRLPQDGRMRIAVRGQEIDLRVSVLPSVHGETFVLRVLDRSGVDLRLDALGYQAPAISTLRELVHIPNGIVLVTGPTGSGKTTTLYSLLKERDASEVKIFTVEDPVEYRLDGITQLQVDPAIDLTFARALRSVLRQDPDIILIGEIRDKESAQIAIQASLTGHLVFSTLHTNSALGALTRLRDMGLDDYLIAATIRAAIAQRLVRKVCGRCGNGDGTTERRPDPTCPSCRGTGYSGRSVVYEIVEISPELATLISGGADEETLNRHARQHGAVSMAKHAETMIAAGTTTREEVRRVLELGGT